ncbi:M23 family metallopeptidase [Flavobacteriaceae bacterium AU392]|nr:M23 family peptidase [Flavobacteriaceae bacterium]RKM82766.1 M23 family metallopeptidase [Flavobacteriaceae bacterium AU392]
MKKITLLFIIICFNSYSQEVAFKKVVEKDSTHINIINYLYAPIEANITPVETLKARIKIKPYFILEKRDTIYKILSIPNTIIKDTSKITVTDYLKFDLVLGDPNTIKHNNKYLYALPYPKGKTYSIIQSFKGKFSHSSTRSKYAIDFNLQIGDTITAAREGIVVRIKDEYKEHGGRDFIDKANLVTIIHDDGTIAAYVHLDYKSVFVKPGDYVKKGQPIGLSGFTGFSTKPHLHFVVRKEQNIAIPIYFEGYAKKILKKNKRYKRH